MRNSLKLKTKTINNIITYLLSLLLLALSSCSKDSTSKLNVEITLGDNGVVSVIAQAEGALSYRFSFGDESVYNNSSGIIEHTYSNKGTYTFAVWAFFNEGQTDYSFESTEIEITNATGETNNGGLLDLSEAVTEYPGYELVWNDEFNYEGAPHDFRWHLQYKPILGWGWANDEKQHYTTRRDNSYVSDGTLKIVAKRESYSYNGTNKQFTSARLNSKFDMKYGRIDVRAKLPSKGGTWPAIWTLGTNINELGNYHGSTDGNVGWPRCGEIDIMEQRGYNKHEILGTFHWGETQSPYNYGSYGETRSTSQLGITNVTTNFHLYSLVWSSTELKIYVDNKFLVSLSNSATVPFDNPHYLLLNVAMGGTLGGNIPGSFDEDVMEIDYVRFYQ
jgi:beta-glucanase (GH16 family)